MRRLVNALAVGCALFGGGILLLLVSITTLSVIGRALVPFGLAPISGDFEIVEIGVAIAVFAALPFCHLNRGHAVVDLMQPWFGTRLNRILDMAIDGIVLIASLVLTRQLWFGMLDKRLYLETTLILQIPQWWGYLACFVMGCVLCVIAMVRAGDSLPAIKGGHVE